MKGINQEQTGAEALVITAEYDTDYQVGQDNVQVFGLDVHNPVFGISAGLTLLFIIGTLLFPTGAKEALTGARSWSIEHFDWLFMVGCNLFVVFCLALILLPGGPYPSGRRQRQTGIFQPLLVFHAVRCRYGDRIDGSGVWPSRWLTTPTGTARR